VRFSIPSAAAVALAALLLAAGCGGSDSEPEVTAEVREPSRVQRGARELALLHERRARREARVAGEQTESLSSEQLANEAEQIARLEEQLALAMAGEPLPDDESYGQRAPDTRAPRSFEPGAFPQLQEPDEDLRADAVFDADPDDDIEMLVVAMQDESSVVREAAAEQLGDSERDLALDALIGALQDEDEEVALAVISALEWRDDPRAIPALRVALEERPEEDVRDAVQDAIDWLEED